MYSLKELSKRKITQNDLEIILKWRNHKKIRNNMINNKLINKKDHFMWFKTINKNPNIKAFLVFYEKNLFGYLNIEILDNKKKLCTFGMYLRPDISFPGLGLLLEIYTLKFIFTNLKMKKITGKVLKSNSPMIKIHELMGFKFKKIIKKENFKNILEVSLTKEKWLDRLKKIKNKYSGFLSF